jgi:hypothetical protein
MRTWMWIGLAAATAWGGTAPAQTEPPSPTEDDMSIYVPDRRSLIVRPNPEVMALARRLAEATGEREIWQALSERLADPEAAERPPAGFGPRDLAPPIVARGALPPATGEEMQRRLEIQERVVSRIAAYYAASFDLGELRQMVAFFESPAGRRFQDRRPDMIAHIRGWMQGPEFEAELIEAICRPPAPEGPKDGPDRAYVRIFPEQAPSPPAEADSRCRAAGRR